jgi:hypothetical protein
MKMELEMDSPVFLRNLSKHRYIYSLLARISFQKRNTITHTPKKHIYLYIRMMATQYKVE